MVNKDENLQEEILANHQLCNDELRFFKQQQWQVTYYCLVLLAAIYFLKDGAICVDYLRYFIWAVFGIGICLLVDIQRALYKHRKIIANIQKEYFEEETREYLNMTDKDFDRYSNPLYDCKYIVVFGLVITVACFVVQYVVSTTT